MNWGSANNFTAGGASWGSPLAPGSFNFKPEGWKTKTTKTKPKKPFTQLSLQNRDDWRTTF